VEIVPSEAIAMPEPVDQEDYYNPQWNVIVAPDPNIGAWVEQTPVLVEGTYELKIGDIFSEQRTASFSVPIQSRASLIGWRPSD
jgi:hypothetical protein